MAKTLYDFGREIRKVREAVNSMEIKGRQNAAYVVYINCQCDELINDLDEITRNAENATQAPTRNAENATQAPTRNEETDGDLNERDSRLP